MPFNFPPFTPDTAPMRNSCNILAEGATATLIGIRENGDTFVIRRDIYGIPISVPEVDNME